MGPITGVYAGDASVFSIRSVLATDFAAYGLPRSLKKPRAASSFETSRNDSYPALVDVFLGYVESEYLRSKLLLLLGVMVI